MKKDKIALIAVLCAVFCPALPILGNPENISALIFLFLIINSKNAIVIRGLIFSVITLSLLFFLSSLFPVFIEEYGQLTFSINSIGVYFRIIFCYLAILLIKNPKEFQRNLLIIGILSCLFAILQSYSDVAITITKKFYLNEERVSVFNFESHEESVIRPISFFENPSSVALVSIVSLLMAIKLFSIGVINKFLYLLCMIIAMISGFLSLSKIIIFGIPLIFLELIILKQKKILIFVLSILSIAAIILIANGNILVDLLVYTINSSFELSSAFNGRYNDEQINTIINGIFFGHGFFSNNSVIINDSLYLILLYTFGIIGTLLIAIALFYILFIKDGQIDFSYYCIFLIIALSGIGSNSIIGYRVDIFLTALLTTFLVKDKIFKSNKIC